MNNYQDPKWVAGYSAALAEVGEKITRRVTELEQAELIANADRFATVHELRMLAAHCEGTMQGLAEGLALVEDSANGRVAS